MKLKLSALALAALLSAGLSSAAFAQAKPVELRFGYWIPPSHSLIPSSEAWAKSIAEASNGSIKVTIYPSEQLGKAFDHYDLTRDGIADLALVNPGYQPGRFPIAAAGEQMFLFENAISGSRAYDEWYRKYAARDMKDVHYCLGFIHDPGTLHMKKALRTPDQLKGLKVRPANGTTAFYLTGAGAAPVQASAPEMRELLERGVIDGSVGPWDGVFLFKTEELTKFHVDLKMYSPTFAWVMNKDKYSAMSADQKKVIDSHCTPEWAEKIATPWAQKEAAGRDKARAAGHEMYKPTAAEEAQWRKAGEPVFERWAAAIKKLNLDPAKLMDELRASLKKHNALL